MNENEWTPTMYLRWVETPNYKPHNDCFEKVLQQKYLNTEGKEKWVDVEIISYF